MRTGILVLAIITILLLVGCTNPQNPPTTSTQSPTLQATASGDEVPDVTPAPECLLDDDCFVGGCSGQLCGTKDAVEGRVTTCEYRDEYSCLQLTSCGCVQGSCIWKETPEYTSCMAEKSQS